MNIEGADLAFLQEFVREVLTVCRYDSEDVTYGLEDLALSAGQIVGLSKLEMESLLNGESE